MLSRIAALLPLCSHVRVLVSAARPKESSFLQGLRFNGDGATFNPFGTVNIGGTTIIDATGGVGTYTQPRDSDKLRFHSLWGAVAFLSVASASSVCSAVRLQRFTF